MARESSDEKWVLPNSLENEVEKEEEEEEEALSLCDLPINEEKLQSRKQEPKPAQPEEDFDFSSLGGGGGSVLTESEMCAADEVFFQGQILPFRNSISSENGLALSGCRNSSRNPSRCVSRSESMDHFYSAGGFTSTFSSRSSSVRSYHSSSSGSTSTITTNTKSTPYKPKARNQFHSHPSPTPRIRVSGVRPGNTSRSKSTIWSFFKVGLVRTPEIELQDLKSRSINNINSMKSSSSGSGNGNNNNDNAENGLKIRKKKKQQLGLFDKNGTSGLFGGCKCSVNSTVDQTLQYSRIVLRKSKSVSVSTSVNTHHVEEADHDQKEETMKKTKQAMSRHRTFEWLKELSLVGVPVEA